MLLQFCFYCCILSLLRSSAKISAQRLRRYDVSGRIISMHCPETMCGKRGHPVGAEWSLNNEPLTEDNEQNIAIYFNSVNHHSVLIWRDPPISYNNSVILCRAFYLNETPCTPIPYRLHFNKCLSEVQSPGLHLLDSGDISLNWSTPARCRSNTNFCVSLTNLSSSHTRCGIRDTSFTLSSEMITACGEYNITIMPVFSELNGTELSLPLVTNTSVSGVLTCLQPCQCLFQMDEHSPPICDASASMLDVATGSEQRLDVEVNNTRRQVLLSCDSSSLQADHQLVTLFAYSSGGVMTTIGANVTFSSSTMLDIQNSTTDDREESVATGSKTAVICVAIIIPVLLLVLFGAMGVIVCVNCRKKIYNIMNKSVEDQNIGSPKKLVFDVPSQQHGSSRGDGTLNSSLDDDRDPLPFYQQNEELSMTTTPDEGPVVVIIESSSDDEETVADSHEDDEPHPFSRSLSITEDEY